jgi:hypothetical protein
MPIATASPSVAARVTSGAAAATVGPSCRAPPRVNPSAPPRRNLDHHLLVEAWQCPPDVRRVHRQHVAGVVVEGVHRVDRELELVDAAARPGCSAIFRYRAYLDCVRYICDRHGLDGRKLLAVLADPGHIGGTRSRQRGHAESCKCASEV